MKSHDPGPSTSAFERGLGAVYARWRCDKCRDPLGPGPWKRVGQTQIDGRTITRNYHPACYAQPSAESAQRGRTRQWPDAITDEA